MKRPLLPLFLTVWGALTLFCAWDGPWEILPPLAWSAAAAAAGALFLGRKRTAAVLAVAAVALLYPAAFGRFREEYRQRCESPLPQDQVVTLSGRVTSFPEIAADHWTVEIAADTFSFLRRQVRDRQLVRLNVAGAPLDLVPGDMVEAATVLRPPTAPRNFTADPMEDHWLSRGITRLGRCKSPLLVQVTERGPLFQRVLGRWRHAVRALIRRGTNRAGQPDPAGVFLLATILGDRGGLTTDLQLPLVRSGVFHLIAISGANIGMIAVVLLWSLKRIGLGRRLRHLLTGVVLLLYLAISGGDVSTLRAVIMALLVFAGRLLFRDTDPLNLLAAAGLLTLALHPGQFLDAGFALTYILSAGIVLGRGWLPLLPCRLPAAVREFLCAHANASLLSLPLALHFFLQYSLVGPAVGIVLVPLAAVVTVLTVPILLLAPLGGALALLQTAAAAWLLRPFFFLLHAAADLPQAAVWRPAPGLPVLLLFLFAFVLAVRPGSRRGLRLAGGGVLLVLVVWLLLPTGPRPRPYPEIYFLDVGQGDCAVAVDTGGDALLIDGGGATFGDLPMGRRTVLPFLVRERIRVRWVALSHTHGDHLRGLSEIIADLRPEELWLAGAPADDPLLQRLLAAAPPSTRLVRATAGYRRRLGGLEAEVLHPAGFSTSLPSDNHRSMVLRLHTGRHAVLFCGDIERGEEEALTTAMPARLAAEIVKIPHHGSRSSCHEPFLRAVRPALAVISLGAANAFGFPHRETLHTLRRLGVPVLRTARSGGIRVVSAPGGWTVEVSR